MNEQLAEVLINNLLSNSLNHNVKGGKIQISIIENEFKIYNTSKINMLTNGTVFNRFVKGNSKSNSLGLALDKKYAIYIILKSNIIRMQCIVL